MRVVCLDMMETHREAMTERMSKWFDIADDAQIKYSANGCYLMNCRRECHLHLSERAAVQAGRQALAGFDQGGAAYFPAERGVPVPDFSNDQPLSFRHRRPHPCQRES